MWYGAALRGDVNSITVGRQVMTFPVGFACSSRVSITRECRNVMKQAALYAMPSWLGVGVQLTPCLRGSNSHIGDRTVVHVASEAGSVKGKALNTSIGDGVSIGERSRSRRHG